MSFGYSKNKQFISVAQTAKQMINESFVLFSLLHDGLRETAAAAAHDHWMSTNERNAENAHLHVPYSELPEEEKNKDRAHVDQISAIARDNNLDIKNPEHHEEILHHFGKVSHEDWLANHRRDLAAKGEPIDTERPRPVPSGGLTNINVPWDKLHPERQEMFKPAGRVVLGSLYGNMTGQQQFKFTQTPPGVDMNHLADLMTKSALPPETSGSGDQIPRNT